MTTSLTAFEKGAEKFFEFSGRLESDQLKAGAIQSFEYCFELSWKTLQRILLEKGIVANSPRDAFRSAGQNELIDDVEQWIDFIRYRNLTVHTYDESLLKEVVEILPVFRQSLKKLVDTLKKHEIQSRS